MNKEELIILKQLNEIDDLKQENMKLKDKVEGLDDKLYKIREIITLRHQEMTNLLYRELLEVLEGDDK